MGKTGAGLGVQELNFLQNRLGLGAGFDPDQFKNLAPGATGYETPEDEARLRAQLLSSVGGDGTGANTNQAGINDIIQRLIGVQQTTAGTPQLATLDAGAQGSLDAISRANQAAFDLRRQQAQNELLQGLFGSGTAQSTIALDQAGRLNYGQDALQAQLLSDAAQRELGLRNTISDRLLANLGLQTQTLGQAGGLAVNAGELGSRDAQLRASLLDSVLGRGFQREAGNVAVNQAERARAFNQDQFRQSLLSNLGNQTAALQSQRQSPLGKVLNAGLSLASFALPGGGTIGGSLLSKLPGLSTLLKPRSSGGAV